MNFEITIWLFEILRYVNAIFIWARIGGGQRPKRGPILAYSDQFFGAEGAEKFEKWAKVTHFWRRRRRNFFKIGVI